ncbi:MAG: hypothetical protein DCC67_12430 [Planctomycetota bacterium]|nr:MAG: hypothetical protein DCC67_12430 [Planctomycetota bacterium]
MYGCGLMTQPGAPRISLYQPRLYARGLRSAVPAQAAAHGAYGSTDMASRGSPAHHRAACDKMTGSSTSAHPPADPLRVLVVDDHHDGATSLALMLRMLGYDSRAAYSGREALDVAVSFRPDAVFLDLAIPDVNGYEVAKTLRQSSLAMVLIALTGMSREADRTRAQESGFDDFLIKPASLDELKAVLARVPRRAGPISPHGPAI